MNQIARYDWLPKQARWSYLARSGLPAMSHEKKLPESQIVIMILASFFSFEFMDRGKKRTWPTSSHLDLTLGQ